MTQRAPVIYLPHGGGPMPLLGDPGHTDLTNFLRELPQRFDRPKAIVIISAHWEEPVATINAAPAPPMLFDYYGFPEQAYRIRYPAPGAPELAMKLGKILQAQEIDYQLNNDRGFDHGVFVPLALMYPDADIPVVQLSLIRGLDPAQHIALGEALGNITEQNILILGSGMSFHNLRTLMSDDQRTARTSSDQFHQWLVDNCCNASLSYQQRKQYLSHWDTAPGARLSHPREEHLMPLHVCLGASQNKPGPASLIFNEALMGHKVAGFLW